MKRKIYWNNKPYSFIMEAEIKASEYTLKELNEKIK